jgi:hypothetical protein
MKTKALPTESWNVVSFLAVAGIILICGLLNGSAVNDCTAKGNSPALCIEVLGR